MYEGQASTSASAPAPATMRAAVRAEWRRALHPPYETPSVVVGNGLLLTACWTLLPASAVSSLFRFHGPLVFAAVLATWMYSDVPATNLLGGDPQRSIAALPDPVVLRRMWYAKNVIVWALVTPVCALIAIGIGIYENRLGTTLLTVLWIAAVPLGALGFSSWLGVWFPYHVLPLRYRWARRRRWRRMLARRLALVLAPYAVVPLLTAVLTLPSVLLWAAVAPAKPAKITDEQFAWGLLLAAVLAVTAWTVGHWLGPRLAHRRSETLTEFLRDPERG
jgi:hypothetical protein